MGVKFSQIWNKVSQVLECTQSSHCYGCPQRHLFCQSETPYQKCMCGLSVECNFKMTHFKKVRDILRLKQSLPLLLYLRGMNKEILEAASPFAPHRKMNLYLVSEQSLWLYYDSILISLWHL